MIDRLLNVFAPHRCCSCGETGALLCEGCKNDIVDEPFSGCVLCHRPCGEKGLCFVCARRLSCEQAWCVGERSGVLKELLDRYKFSGSRAGALVCAEMLDNLLPALPADIAIVGVPTSPATLRVRGFDHVGRVVRLLAKRRHLQVARPLKRTSSATLHFLSRDERVALGPFLFGLSYGTAPEQVLLIDDILTTGTTLAAATKLLKQAGAKRVYIAVVARQPEG